MKKRITTLLLIIIVAFQSNSQCLARLMDESTVSVNPENGKRGDFHFDYKIESDIEMKTSDGIVKRYNVDYYVNTADGSIFFEKKFGFFGSDDLPFDSRMGKVDGTIIFPNGQITVYVYDAKSDKKRALNFQSNKSLSDAGLDNYTRMMQFLNSLNETSEHPEPLPETVVWSGVTQGYKGKVYSDKGDEVKITMYFDTNPTQTIRTNQPITGFLVGVVKDFTIKKCNRLAVFTKMEIPSKNYYIQAGLLSINKFDKTFNTSDYKPGKIAGMMGTDIKRKSKDFRRRWAELTAKMEMYKKKKKECTSYECMDRYKKLIKEAKEEGKQLECEIAKAMGMEDKLEDCK